MKNIEVIRNEIINSNWESFPIYNKEDKPFMSRPFLNTIKNITKKSAPVAVSIIPSSKDEEHVVVITYNNVKHMLFNKILDLAKSEREVLDNFFKTFKEEDSIFSCKELQERYTSEQLYEIYQRFSKLTYSYCKYTKIGSLDNLRIKDNEDFLFLAEKLEFLFPTSNECTVCTMEDLELNDKINPISIQAIWVYTNKVTKGSTEFVNTFSSDKREELFFFFDEAISDWGDVDTVDVCICAFDFINEIIHSVKHPLYGSPFDFDSSRKSFRDFIKINYVESQRLEYPVTSALISLLISIKFEN